MLTFEQKLAIIASFPELQRKDVSLGRVNFHYEESAHEKKTVVYHLHPNGNGYVYGGLLDDTPCDAKGMVNIRDCSETELRGLVERSIASLSEPPPADEWPPPGVAERLRKRRRPAEESWIGPDQTRLKLLLEDDLWYLYAGLNLEMAFETYDEAVQYLEDEQFRRE